MLRNEGLLRQRVGYVLRHARARKGLSKTAIAARLAKPVSWVASLEAGREIVFVDDITSVALAYDIDRGSKLVEAIERAAAVRKRTGRKCE